MKQILSVFIFSIFLVKLYSQEIKYKLVLTDTCSNQFIQNDPIWIFRDTSELQAMILPEVDLMKDYTLLRDTGTYFLSKGYFRDLPDKNPFHIVRISSYGIYNDTVVSDYLQEVLHKSSSYTSWSEYLCCGKKCNGMQSYYYENGTKKIAGTFLNGQPIGTFRSYYYSGNMREERIYRKNYREFSYFDFTGLLIEKHLEKRIDSYPFWITKKLVCYNYEGQLNKKTNYSDSLSVKQISINNRENKQFEIIGNRKTEYDKSGNVKRILSWRKKLIQYNLIMFKLRNLSLKYKTCSPISQYDYILKNKEFDEDGNLTIMARLEAWSQGKYFILESYMDADWIDSYKVYKNKQVSTVIRGTGIEDIR